MRIISILYHYAVIPKILQILEFIDEPIRPKIQNHRFWGGGEIHSTIWPICLLVNNWYQFIAKTLIWSLSLTSQGQFSLAQSSSVSYGLSKTIAIKSLINRLWSLYVYTVCSDVRLFQSELDDDWFAHLTVKLTTSVETNW